MRRKQKKYAEQLLGIGCRPIISYIKDLSVGLTCSACTIVRLSSYWLSYMRGVRQSRRGMSLATLASSSTKGIPWLTKVELVAEPSISVGVGDSLVAMVELCWMDLIINFLAEDHVPDDEKEVEKVHWTATRYWLSADRKLYRRSFGGSYLQCLHHSKVKQLLVELHARCATIM